jgi:ribosomal protein S27E
MYTENNKVMKIKCQDCGNNFTFSEIEQRFYEEKGFVPPKRCKACRNARTLRRKNSEQKGV